MYVLNICSFFIFHFHSRIECVKICGIAADNNLLYQLKKIDKLFKMNRIEWKNRKEIKAVCICVWKWALSQLLWFILQRRHSKVYPSESIFQINTQTDKFIFYTEKHGTTKTILNWFLCIKRKHSSAWGGEKNSRKERNQRTSKKKSNNTNVIHYDLIEYRLDYSVYCHHAIWNIWNK